MNLAKMSIHSRVCLSLALLIMGSFFTIQSLVVFGYVEASYLVALFGYGCVLSFAPPFFLFVREFLQTISSSELELLEELKVKNTYLEHAAKILRHDMHSGINTYLPRGIKSLKRRLSKDQIKELKLEIPLRLLTDGLEHSQQVYRGVFEFTNLVKNDDKISLSATNLSSCLRDYLKRTSYADQIIIEPLGMEMVNEPLFCTAIDNLIRNGLKYNDSSTKCVKITRINKDMIGVQDNGRGLSSEQFEELSKPYARKKDQKEKGSGLGLNICVAIFKEHGFEVSAEKLDNGTLVRIKLR